MSTELDGLAVHIVIALDAIKGGDAAVDCEAFAGRPSVCRLLSEAAQLLKGALDLVNAERHEERNDRAARLVEAIDQVIGGKEPRQVALKADLFAIRQPEVVKYAIVAETGGTWVYTGKGEVGGWSAIVPA